MKTRELRSEGLGGKQARRNGLLSTITREARFGFVEGHKETARSYYILAPRSALLAQRK